MVATLQIRDTEDGLSIRVTKGRRGWTTLLDITGASLFFYFLYHSSASQIVLILITAFCVFVLLKDIMSGVRGTNVEMRVTNLDLISTGQAPGGYAPSSVSRADIYNLEFKEANSGRGRTEDLPDGLYVQHHGDASLHGHTCILPHIDKPQTEKVIQAILRRFPDTETIAPTLSFEPYLTTLNLSSPRRSDS
jgi:hypothetical protein